MKTATKQKSNSVRLREATKQALKAYRLKTKDLETSDVTLIHELVAEAISARLKK